MPPKTDPQDDGFESLLKPLTSLFNGSAGGSGMGWGGILMLGISLMFGFENGNLIQDIGKLFGGNGAGQNQAQGQGQAPGGSATSSILPNALAHPIDYATQKLHEAEDWAGIHRDNSKTVAVLGDSLGNGTAGALRGKFNTVNLAKDGRRLSEVTPDQIAQVPKGAACVISILTNDIPQDRAISETEAKAWADKAVNLAGTVKDQRGATVALTELKAQDSAHGAAWAANLALVDKYLKPEAQQRGIGFVSVDNVTEWAKDGMHHGTTGYQQMAANAAQTLGLNA